jgi:hypothetical protein
MSGEGEGNGIQRTLGRLEAGVDGLRDMLADHTAADTANFNRLEEHLLRLGAAVTAAPAPDTTAPAPTMASKAKPVAWGTVVAGVLTTAAEIARRYLLN